EATSAEGPHPAETAAKISSAARGHVAGDARRSTSVPLGRSALRRLAALAGAPARHRLQRLGLRALRLRHLALELDRLQLARLELFVDRLALGGGELLQLLLRVLQLVLERVDPLRLVARRLALPAQDGAVDD